MRTVVLGLAAGSAVALVAAVGAGCGGTEGDNLFGSGVGGATTSAAGPSTTGSNTVTTTAVTGTGGATTSATTSSVTGGNTTSATTTSGSGPATTTSTSTGGGECAPQSGDDACTKCAKSSCCNDVIACSNDQNCTCWVTCLQQHPNNPQICAGTCGNPDGNVQALGQCTQNGGPCAQACGGGSTTTTTTTTTGSGGGACGAQPGDSACTTCSKMKCCSSVTACATDTNCQCWVQCLGNNGGNLCQQICGGFDGTTTQLFQCAGSQCQGICQ